MTSVDSYKILIMTISAASLSRRGVRKVPQRTTLAPLSNLIVHEVDENHSTAFYDFCNSMDHSDHSNCFDIFKNPLVKVLALQRTHNTTEPTVQMNVPDG